MLLVAAALGAMRMIAFITEAGSIHRILEYLGEPPIPAHRAPGPPDGEGDFDTREGGLSG